MEDSAEGISFRMFSTGFIKSAPRSTELTNRSSNFWTSLAEKRAVQLFQAAAKRVPAYKKFLVAHHIQPSLIKTTDDLKRVPFIDKENYLRKYPLHELAWAAGSQEQVRC